MSWFKQKLDVLGKRKDFERRTPRQMSLSQVEQLESRLCLGSLNSPDLGNWTPDDPGGSGLGSMEVGGDLLTDQTTQVEPDDGLGMPSNQTQTGTTQTVVEQTSDSSTEQTSGSLQSDLDPGQTQIHLAAASSSEGENDSPGTESTGTTGTGSQTQTAGSSQDIGVVSNTGAGHPGSRAASKPPRLRTPISVQTFSLP